MSSDNTVSSGLPLSVPTGSIPTIAPSAARLLGLDLLRLLAILAVLGRHLWQPVPSYHPVGRWFFNTWYRGGWVGVDLFFVLSGFLVSGLLFREYQKTGRLGVLRFYTRRGWKIYPPFFALIVTTIAVSLWNGWNFSWRQVLVETCFVQSYWVGLWNHTWSLAVEEHFYLLLPLILLVVLRFNRGGADPFRPLVTIGVAVGVGLLLLRMRNSTLGPFNFYRHMFATHLRLDSLFFGVLIAYAYQFHHAWFVATWSRWRRLLICVGLICLAPAFMLPVERLRIVSSFGFTLFYLGSGMILTGVLLTNWPRTKLVVGLATLGSYSYSIYLWHMPVKNWFVPWTQQLLDLPLSFALLSTLYVVGSLAVGVVLARVIEFPMLRLRDHWFPAHVAGLPTANPVSAQPETPFDPTGNRSSAAIAAAPIADLPLA